MIENIFNFFNDISPLQYYVFKMTSWPFIIHSKKGMIFCIFYKNKKSIDFRCFFIFIPLFAGSKTPISNFSESKKARLGSTVRKSPVGEG